MQAYARTTDAAPQDPAFTTPSSSRNSENSGYSSLSSSQGGRWGEPGLYRERSAGVASVASMGQSRSRATVLMEERDQLSRRGASVVGRGQGDSRFASTLAQHVGSASKSAASIPVSPSTASVLEAARAMVKRAERR